MRAAARAKRTWARAALRSFLYVTVGTGISACLVIDAMPYAGARGLTGTFASSGGLIPGNDGQLHAGPPLESVCGRARHWRRDSPKRGRIQGAAPDVLRLAASGDSHARKIVASAGTALGAAIANWSTCWIRRRS